MNKRKRHNQLLSFLILGAILGIGLGLLLIYNYNFAAQTAIVFWLGAGYVAWGGLFHWQKGDLNAKILLEYVLIACLVVGILMTLLLRA